MADDATAGVSNGALIGMGTGFNGVFDVRLDSFSTGNLSLAAGTYYLWLQNAATSDDGGGYWDINNGPSAAFIGESGNFAGDLAGEFGPTSSDALPVDPRARARPTGP